jgi:hypothetical protein
MMMMKLSHRLAALATVVSLSLAAPGLAFAEDHSRHDASHGPMPLAILGSVFGGAFWLASTPFCLLLAPKHIGDSFDLLVAAPWRAAIGSETP